MVLGLLAGEFQEGNGWESTLGLSGNTPVKRAGLFAEVPTERHVAAYGMGNQSIHIELGTSAQ